MDSEIQFQRFGSEGIIISEVRPYKVNQSTTRAWDRGRRASIKDARSSITGQSSRMPEFGYKIARFNTYKFYPLSSQLEAMVTIEANRHLVEAQSRQPSRIE